MALTSAARDPRASTGRSHRSEWLAGYGFIAIPMLLFLILNIGSIGLRPADSMAGSFMQDS